VNLKSITLRLPEDEYVAFNTVCDERGYSKTGKIREFIRNLVKEEIASVKISTKEWEKVQFGIKEIKRGEFTTFKELTRDFAKKKVGNK